MSEYKWRLLGFGRGILSTEHHSCLELVGLSAGLHKNYRGDFHETWMDWLDWFNQRVLPWHRQRYALYWVPFQLRLLSGWRKERKWGGVWRRSGVNRTSNINTGDRFLLPTDSQQWFPLTTTTISPNFNKVVTLVPKHTTSPHGGEERHPPGKDFSQ